MAIFFIQWAQTYEAWVEAESESAARQAWIDDDLDEERVITESLDFTEVEAFPASLTHPSRIHVTTKVSTPSFREVFPC